MKEHDARPRHHWFQVAAVVRKAVSFALGVSMLTSTAWAEDRAFYRKTHDGYRLPDHQATPGAIAHHDLATICNTKWGKDARAVTAKMKADAYQLYRAKKVDKQCCEVDHLISRDVGGADEPANLWPQPWAEAHLKDRVEVEAKNRVCDGRADLADVQRTMAEDWTRLHREWFGVLPRK